MEQTFNELQNIEGQEGILVLTIGGNSVKTSGTFNEGDPILKRLLFSIVCDVRGVLEDEPLKRITLTQANTNYLLTVDNDYIYVVQTGRFR
eukprot:Clim_evm22s109 gene=Clim_evmTU22s109